MNGLTLMALASVWGNGDCMPYPRRDPLEGIDIEAERELIKAKKSNLSARLREMVIAKDNMNDNTSDVMVAI